jgi:alpha-beta hydrolase superfamily lysophospholipase
MFDEDYFKSRVNSFYAEVDRAFRTLGCEALGSQDIFFRLSRVATPTIEYSEIKRILADIDGPPLGINEPSGHRRWPLAWGRAMKRYKEIAEKAEASGHKVTAGSNFLRASLLAHSGQLFCRPEWPEKFELQRERAECYRRAAPYLGIKELHVPYEGGHALPAYLWIPKGVSHPPVVLMAPGANSVKEELHRWAAAFVERDLAVMTFDGPGQGELTPLMGSNLPMRYEEYHKAITAMIDYLESHESERVNTRRIALWGQGGGGYLVTRAFEKEKRPVAIVNLGGSPTMVGYPYKPPDVMEENRDLLGFKTYEEAWKYIQEHGDGLAPARSINVPYLIVHGSRDDIIGEEAMINLAKTVGETAELVIYKDGNHGVFNWDFIMTDAMADWLVDKLIRKQG